MGAVTSLYVLCVAAAAEHSGRPDDQRSDCLLVGRVRTSDPPPCETKYKGDYAESPTFSAIIQTFKDQPRQAKQLLVRLRAIPMPKEIIVNDDSHGSQSSSWVPMLTRANEFYISSPNLHEVRAYNRLALMARGEFLVFVQGDTCLPSASAWMEDAIRIFRTLPRLAMLSGRVGYDEVLNYQMTSAYRDVRTWGSAPYKAIDHVLPNAGHPIPFRFAPGTDSGPLFYRREALLRIGGFDESYSCAPGHVSGHYDFDVSLRFWIHDWQVGVFYGGSMNGMGGRKTLRTRNLRTERHTNELWNGKRVERLWREHNATIASRLGESLRRHLSYLPPDQRESLRQASLARTGKHNITSKKQLDRCYDNLVLPKAIAAAAALLKLY
jgi:GT2 family glycosyltransferase